MKRMDRRGSLILLSASAIGATILPTGTPQASPVGGSRAIRLVVPFPAGGVTDLAARLVAEGLGEHIGRQVIVENRAGAGGNIAAESVARAPADGQVLFMGTTGTNAGINAAMYDKVGYDYQRDFAPVGMVIGVQAAIVVNPSVQIHSVSELITSARQQPGLFSMASPGAGTAPHLAGELFKSAAGIKIQHIPYRGDAPALTEVLGGQVQLMVANLPSLIPHIRSRRLRALAVLGPERSPALPEVPTMVESGYPGVAIKGWAALFAPVGTPPQLITSLNEALVATLQKPATRRRFEELGAEAIPSSPADLAGQILREAPVWSRLVKESGATAN